MNLAADEVENLAPLQDRIRDRCSASRRGTRRPASPHRTEDRPSSSATRASAAGQVSDHSFTTEAPETVYPCGFLAPLVVGRIRSSSVSRGLSHRRSRVRVPSRTRKPRADDFLDKSERVGPRHARKRVLANRGRAPGFWADTRSARRATRARSSCGRLEREKSESAVGETRAAGQRGERQFDSTVGSLRTRS
jgi:hypothetical protein